MKTLGISPICVGRTGFEPAYTGEITSWDYRSLDNLYPIVTTPTPSHLKPIQGGVENKIGLKLSLLLGLTCFVFFCLLSHDSPPFFALNVCEY